ncbi:MAG: ParB/RepB/Spo0J family partition protein [Candidatus Omnitrophica bacterium]|nr:ParB/RepB/Spo0J family partition protein [Candidatus Omnitrophota bacterium]
MELKKKVLGKGLSALIPDSYLKVVEAQKEAQKIQAQPVESGIQEIPISDIRPNREQPRHRFPEERIAELAASIREQGILQPVIVKKLAEGYELVCGERRVKAAEKCGLDKIPAIVKDLAEDKLLEWALVENIQREDLNPIEEAQAYMRLIEGRDLSHDEIAKKVGKDRSTIANTIRLLRLPGEILEGLIDGRLQAGHARALLSLPTPEHQRQLAKRIMEERLSVRQVEEMVGRSVVRKRRAKIARSVDQDVISLETKLERKLGTQVRIFPKRDGQGRIEIRYYSLDDLDRLLNLLGISQI